MVHAVGLAATDATPKIQPGQGRRRGGEAAGQSLQPTRRPERGVVQQFLTEVIESAQRLGLGRVPGPWVGGNRAHPLLRDAATKIDERSKCGIGGGGSLGDGQSAALDYAALRQGMRAAGRCTKRRLMG